MKLRVLPLLACVALSACVTTAPPVGSNMKLDTEVAGQCTHHCHALGMRLSAVVIIMNSTGCVCEPASGEQSAGASRDGAAQGPSAAVSGAAVQAVVAQQRRPSQAGEAPSQPGPTPLSPP